MRTLTSAMPVQYSTSSPCPSGACNGGNITENYNFMTLLGAQNHPRQNDLLKEALFWWQAQIKFAKTNLNFETSKTEASRLQDLRSDLG